MLYTHINAYIMLCQIMPRGPHKNIVCVCTCVHVCVCKQETLSYKIKCLSCLIPNFLFFSYEFLISHHLWELFATLCTTMAFTLCEFPLTSNSVSSKKLPQPEVIPLFFQLLQYVVYIFIPIIKMTRAAICQVFTICQPIGSHPFPMLFHLITIL